MSGNNPACGRKLRQCTLDAFILRTHDNNETTSPNTESENRISASDPNRNAILLPWSQKNLCTKGSGEVCCAWDVITAVMANDISTSSEDLCRLLQALLVHDSIDLVLSARHFNTLCYVLDNIMLPSERAEFFDVALPWMKHLVINGPRVILTDQLPILAQGETRRLILTYEEITTLITCGFFSLFPGRSSYRGKGFETLKELGSFNFVDLLCIAPSDRIESQRAKVRCFLQYFLVCSHNTEDIKPGLELYRVGFSSFPSFYSSTALMQAVNMHAEGCIEESYGNLQVDFANKVIGGGFLRSGCVQEEIRFVTWPELILSRLACESFMDNEVLFMSGSGQYSVTRGYASSFRFIHGNLPQYVAQGNGMHMQEQDRIMVELVSTTRRERTGEGSILLRNSCVVAMDAVDYKIYPEQQYTSGSIVREMQKAFVAFKGMPDGSLISMHSGPIATGRWGCGAFQGDLELKLMIQWCAASQAGRPLIYYTFGDNDLCVTFQRIYEKLRREAWTVGDVFIVLVMFGRAREFTSCAAAQLYGKLFDYILSTPK